MRCQWLEDGPDVDLWPTCGANVKSIQVKVNEFLHELEDPMTKGWWFGTEWTFIEGIKENENWPLVWQP